MKTINLTLLFITSLLLGIYLIGGVNSYGVDGAYNVTINNTQILPNPAYANSLLNGSALININGTFPANVTQCWYNGTTQYFCTTRLNILNLEKVNEPLVPIINDGSLVGCWKFSEMNGTNVSDCLGRQDRYGSVSIAKPYWNNSIYGGGMTFYNSIAGTANISMKVPKVQDFNFTQNTIPINYTISAWFIYFGNSIGSGGIIGDTDATLRPRSFMMSISSNNAIGCSLNATAGATINAVTNGNAIVNNSLYNAVCAFNGESLSIYLNGELRGTATVTTRRITNNTQTSFRIGTSTTNDASNYFFNGSIDEVNIWNRSLTTQEISQIYLNRAKIKVGDIWNYSVNASDNSAQVSLVSSKNTTIISKGTINKNIIVDFSKSLFSSSKKNL